MPTFLCISEPDRRHTVITAGDPLSAIHACNHADGLHIPESNVVEVYLLTPVAPESGQLYFHDGYGSWSGVDDMSVAVLPDGSHEPDDIAQLIADYEPAPIRHSPECSFDQWVSRYRPLANRYDTSASYDGLLYETFGQEYDAISKQPANTIWTLVENDGAMSIIPGRHTINRLGYFVTLKAFGYATAPTVILNQPTEESPDHAEDH